MVSKRGSFRGLAKRSLSTIRCPPSALAFAASGHRSSAALSNTGYDGKRIADSGPPNLRRQPSPRRPGLPPPLSRVLRH